MEAGTTPLWDMRSGAFCPQLAPRAHFLPPGFHKASRGPWSPSSVSQEAGAWRPWAQGQGWGRSQLPLWRHYAIPGAPARIEEAMPRGLEARGCGSGSGRTQAQARCSVRGVVLTPPGLCREDQGPAAVLGPAVQAEVGPKAPPSSSPTSEAQGAEGPLGCSAVLPRGCCRAGVLRPPSDIGGQLPGGPTWPRWPAAPGHWAALGDLGAFYTWRNIGKHATPLWAPFIFPPFTLSCEYF